MPDNNSQLPSIPATPRAIADELGASGLPPSLQILLNDGAYERMKELARVMSKAEGFTPRHLLGKPEACFTIINLALDWKRSPHFVAKHTYQTPSGAIGFDGALIQSILEGSGRFVGAPEIEYHGAWEKLTGKFEKKTSQRGNEYVSPTWTGTDALGLGIIIRWQVRGENKPRVWPGESTPFWLTQCYPLNSPLWATDPKTQIAYLGIRRFANLAAPGILGAASFDYDEVIDASERARDVTPAQRPRPEDYADTGDAGDARQPSAESEPPATEHNHIEIVDLDGVTESYDDPSEAGDFLLTLIPEATRLGKKRLDGLWESNNRAIEIIEAESEGTAKFVYAAFREALASFDTPRDQPTPSTQRDGSELREGEAANSPGDPLPPDAGRQPEQPPRSTSDGAPGARRRGRPPSTERRSVPTNTPVRDPQATPTPADTATGQGPPVASSLAVPLVQKGQGQTDWQETARRMVERIQHCSQYQEVERLPNGRFRQENRQTMDLMRTVDHDAWVSVEYALGQQARALQIQQGGRNR